MTGLYTYRVDLLMHVNSRYKQDTFTQMRMLMSYEDNFPDSLLTSYCRNYWAWRKFILLFYLPQHRIYMSIFVHLCLFFFNKYSIYEWM